MAAKARRINLTIRMLRRQASTQSILSALRRPAGLSRRQAYRYLCQAQRDGQLRPVPEDKAVFTVNLPRRLIQKIRACSHRQGRPISHVVAEGLEQWLQQLPSDG